jgi:hypothetical protein
MNEPRTSSRTLAGASGTILESETTLSQGQESSIEIRQDAKGKPAVTVKVYNPDPEIASDRAFALYVRLTAKLERQHPEHFPHLDDLAEAAEAQVQAAEVERPKRATRKNAR